MQKVVQAFSLDPEVKTNLKSKYGDNMSAYVNRVLRKALELKEK